MPVAAAAIGVAVLLPACADGTPEAAPTVPITLTERESTGSDPAAPTPPSTPTATPTPSLTPIDITTAPPPNEVTPAYVDAVVNPLLATYGQLSAEALAAPVEEVPLLDEQTDETLLAMFRGEYARQRRAELVRLYQNADGVRSDLLSPDRFTGLRLRTQHVQYSQSECIVALGRLDRAGSNNGGLSEPLHAVSLAPNPQPSSKNTSPWVVVDVLANLLNGETAPDERMLQSTLHDYGDALGHTCTDGMG